MKGHFKKMSEEEENQQVEEEEEIKPKKPAKKGKKQQPAPAQQPKIIQMTEDQMEAMLNKMRREYDTANAHVQKEGDVCSVSSIKSTSSTATNPGDKKDPEYLSKSQRMYVLQSFTIPQLRAMHTKKGRSPIGSNKKELVYSAVNLVKTKTSLIDFILSSNPEDDDSDE